MIKGQKIQFRPERTGHLLRNVFLGFVFLCLLMAGKAGAVENENLLQNGSFEEIGEDGLPLGWTRDAYVLDAGYTVFGLTEEDAVDGLRAATIRNIGSNDARLCQTVRLEPESLYCFSGYIRTEEVEEGRGANLSIEGLYTFSKSVNGTSDGWQYVEWYGETGEDQTSATLFARLGGYSGESVGRAWFDDLRLEKVDSVPGDYIAARWYTERVISQYDEAEEVSSASSDSAAWPRLVILSLFYCVLAVLLMQWVRRKPGSEEEKRIHRVVLLLGMALALGLRVVLSYFVQGYMVDVNCFLSWGATMAAHGPAAFYLQTSFCDYPPAYTLVLGLNSLLCNLFPGMSEGVQRIIFRLFPGTCDLLACLALDHFLRINRKTILPRTRVTALLLLAFHPVAIMNSACWGQMDSVLCLLLLLVAVYALEGKWQFCLPCYMLAVLIKPQALMLGFLGLAALLTVWRQQPAARKKLLQGLGAAAAVLIIIVLPFSLRQEPFWLIKKYMDTLLSYPYATVNTANLYYLLDGNWKPIGDSANLWAPVLLGCCALGYALLFRKKSTGRQVSAYWAEMTLCALYLIWNIFCALTGATWGMVGTGAMVFAILLVMSLYLRKGDICFLSYCGGLLFLLLYVFGVKMHERYILPAFLLFALSYGLHRDRRILGILLGLTCTVFINEGIVLDNSIRLGSSMGHLNQDTEVLALMLGGINCFLGAFAVWTGLDLAFPSSQASGRRNELSDPPRDNRLHWKKADSATLAGILILYSLISFSTLGSRKAPQRAWTSSDYTEQVVLDLGERREGFVMLYFAQVSRSDFSVAVSPDGVNWEEEVWAQMDQGQCWKWKYVTDSTQQSDGSRSYGSARHWFDGRYVRITARQINLALCEVLFRDSAGELLPIASVERQGGDPESPLYSDPSLLTDEQDTFEGMPVYFPSASREAEGEENPEIPQPSWWNSTYFDEIYHARTAWEFLNEATPYETSHPPLGKVLMSCGIAIFGMTPFGWRFAGAVAGVAMLAVLYLLILQMTKKTLLAAFGCGLLALDCMHLTQTQIATIDSFPVLFILLAFFFMLRFLQTDWLHAHRRRVLTDLGFSGLAMGLGIASKWIGIYAGAGLAILFFWHGIRVILRQPSAGERKEALRAFLQLCFWCLLFFVAVPLGVYLVSYLPYFAYRHFSSLGDYLDAVMRSQEGMLSYHSTPGLGMDHPFYSPWYEWPVIGKPMYYASRQYLYQDELSYSIFCIGNPVVWWLGIPAMLLCVAAWIRNRNCLADRDSLLPQENDASLDTSLVFLLVGFLAQYLPWTLVPRGTYIYHYFASVPFLILAETLCTEQLLARFPRSGKMTCGLFLAAAGLAFILLFPYVTGILAPVSWLDLGKSVLKIWY